MAAEQKPKPNGGGWKYFIPMAENCRKGWEADEAILKKLEEEREAKLRHDEAWSTASPEPEIVPHIVEINEKVRAPVDPEREAAAAAVRAARAAEIREAREAHERRKQSREADGDGIDAANKEALAAEIGEIVATNRAKTAKAFGSPARREAGSERHEEEEKAKEQGA
jgi:hypothetical protein